MKHINIDFLCGVIITIVILLLAIIIAYFIVKPFKIDDTKVGANRTNKKDN